MSYFTVAQCETMLTSLFARLQETKGISVTTQVSRSKQNHDLSQIEASIKEWERRRVRASRSGIRVRGVTPV